MNFKAIACDRDGTLVKGKTLLDPVRQAIVRFQNAGGLFILATGETVDQLSEFADLDRFDLVIAENGALLHWPRQSRSKFLTSRRSTELLGNLPLKDSKADAIGHVIVSTKATEAEWLRRVVSQCGDWTIAQNRDDIMALPVGIDKGTGLVAAVAEFGITTGDVVGIGDGENDVPLLQAAGLGVTLTSAEPAVKVAADIIMDLEPGIAVIEVIDRILTSQLNATRYQPNAMEMRHGGHQ